MGMIIMMFIGILVFGGLALIYITSIALLASQQNEDLLHLFALFNESVVENRQRAESIRIQNALDEAREQAYENTSLVNIAESQNRTRQLMPDFIESINEIHRIADVTQFTSEVLGEIRFAVKQMRDLLATMTFDQSRIANLTTENANYSQFLRSNFNESMLEETYREYDATQDMNRTIHELQNKVNEVIAQQR
jgi:hypothetical protein